MIKTFIIKSKSSMFSCNIVIAVKIIINIRIGTFKSES